jgi:hypothetical protein
MLPVVKHLFRRYKYDAKRRDLSFELDMDVFDTLIQQLCHYCGCAPSGVYCQPQYKINTVVYQGIDRVNNRHGYTEANVVACCASCNRGKRDMEYKVYRLCRLRALSR